MDSKLVREHVLNPGNHVSHRQFERFILPELESKVMGVLDYYNHYDDKTKQAVLVGIRYSLRFFFKLTGLVKL